MSTRFPKEARLLDRRQFQRVMRQKQRVVTPTLVVNCTQRADTDPARIGLTVSRKFGGAVERNRFKRQVREAFRQCRSELPKGLDLVIRPRSQASQAKMTDIQSDLKQAAEDCKRCVTCGEASPGSESSSF